METKTESVVKTMLHTSIADFDGLQSEWDALLNKTDASTPFSTFAWLRTWWGSYQPGDLWIVTCRDEDGILIGIAPTYIESNSELGRVVRFIGHIDVVDYMDLIIMPGYEKATQQAIATFWCDNRNAFDAIGIANIQETSATYQLMPDILRENEFTVELEQNDVAPLIQLPETYDAYLNDILSSKERKETKRKMRKAEGGLYDVQWYRVSEDHNLHEELDRFLRLMETADAEKAAFLSNPQHVDFFKRVMPQMYAAGYLELLFIRIDGHACATYLNLDYNNTIYVYNSGLDPENYGALSPGIVLLQYAIQYAIDRKRVTFDFLRGNEGYKYKMGGKDTRVFQINAR